MRYYRFFTLVEILIVVGVIAILALLLGGVLRRGQAEGQRLACTSNLRNIITADLRYATENQGFSTANYIYFPVSKSATTAMSWGKVLNGGTAKNPVKPAYLDNTAMFRCAQAGNSDNDDLNLFHTYGKFDFDPKASKIQQSKMAPPQQPFTQWGRVDRYNNVRFLLSRIKNPGRFMLFGETITDDFTNDWQFYKFNPRVAVKSGNKNAALHLRHNQQANIAFADGSVRTVGAHNAADFHVTLYFNENRELIDTEKLEATNK